MKFSTKKYLLSMTLLVTILSFPMLWAGEGPGFSTVSDEEILSAAIGDGCSTSVQRYIPTIQFSEDGDEFSLPQIPPPLPTSFLKGATVGRSLPRTNEWPYWATGSLTITFSGAVRQAVGCMVGPCHVLTIGSAVYDFNTKHWAENITFDPGQDGSFRCFGAAKAVRVLTTREWVEKGASEQNFGLVILNNPIGYETGWYGVMASQEKMLINSPLEVTWYQAGQQPYAFEEAIVEVKPETFGLAVVPSLRPFLGAPVCLSYERAPFVVGVIVQEEGAMSLVTRISMDKLGTLQRWWAVGR